MTKLYFGNQYVGKTHVLGYVIRRKEGNVLFNDALDTFYLRLNGARHMVEYVIRGKKIKLKILKKL